MQDKKQSTGFGFRSSMIVFDEFPIPQYEPPEYDPFNQGHRIFFVRPPQFISNLLPVRMKKIHEEFMKDIKDPHYSFNTILRGRLK